jgi:hypothetical protein
MAITERRTQVEIRQGEARSPGKSVQEIYDGDDIAPPSTLREVSYTFLGDEDIPVERYISREWHDLEVERLWSRVWQFGGVHPFAGVFVSLGEAVSERS